MPLTAPCSQAYRDVSPYVSAQLFPRSCIAFSTYLMIRPSTPAASCGKGVATHPVGNARLEAELAAHIQCLSNPTLNILTTHTVNMGIFRRAISLTGWGALGGTLGYTTWTRNSHIYPLPPTDYLFGTTLFARFNPYSNPSTSDVCVRRVPLKNIRPELIEKEGALVESFCRGVWSGWGYAYQRRFLEKKYRTQVPDQIWDRADLKASTYEQGTKITDHFEVVAKSENSIIVRCGDSPRIQETRASDGLFEMVAEIKKDQGVAEFQLKSVFYNGVAQPDEGKSMAPPMGPWIQWAHGEYDKVRKARLLKTNILLTRL